MASRKNGTSMAAIQDVPIVHSSFPINYGSTSAPRTVTIDADPPTDITPLVYAASDDESAQAEVAPQCRDVMFGVLFYLHIAVMVFLGVFVAPKGYDEMDIRLDQIEQEIAKQDDITPEQYDKFVEFVATATDYVGVYPLRILLYMVWPCVELGILLSFLVAVFVIKPCPQPFVYACLIGSFAWTAILTVGAAVASGAIFMYLFSGFALVASAYYIYVAWAMVPFAAVNLKVALEGMGRNCGMYLMALAFAEIGFCWILYWVYVVIGTSSYGYNECKRAHPEANFEMGSKDYDNVCDMPPMVLIGFLFSFYWTSTIIMVTVAGVMATWCFAPDEANNCCSSAIFTSFYRSVTYSFGSICLGSLLQAVIRVMRYLVERARNQRRQDDQCEGCGMLLLCVLECIARMLEDVIDYFNQWAYIFVGIYGYSYIESGRRVIELFRARGWTSIITDNLVEYVLGFTTFFVAILTGVFAILVEYIVSSSRKENVNEPSYVFGPLPGYRYWAFGVGFVIGLWVCSVLMNVVRGAVNTLIVCWADSPASMEMNHRELTKEMARAWVSVFPEANVQIRPTHDAIVV